MSNASPVAVEFTDLHLSEDTADQGLNIANQAIDLAVKLGAKYLFNGGDTFNSRKAQAMSCLQVFGAILDRCEEEGITMIAIDGNHDKLMYNSEASYLDPFRHHPALKLVKTVAMFTDICEKVNFCFTSYFSDDNQGSSNSIYVKHLKEANEMAGIAKGFNMLITHHGFDGAKSNSGHEVESDINTKHVSNFDAVIVGHYHDETILSKKIHYIGACKQSWYSETTDKGFAVIYNDGSYERVPSEFKKYIEERVVLIGDYTKKIDEVIKKLNKQYPDDNKRLNLVGDRASIRSVDVLSIKKKGVDVRTTDNTTPVTQDEEEFRYVSFDSRAMGHLFMEFMDEEGIVEEEALEYGTDLLRRTLTKVE